MVGGIVVMRQGENALNVIERVKAKLEELKPSLPEGRRGGDHLRPLRAHRPGHRHGQEQAHRGDHHRLDHHPHLPLAHPLAPSSPSSPSRCRVALAFIPMYVMGLNANLMSLAGIAISIGVLVDGAIVEVENAYNKIHHWQAGGRRATSTRSGSRPCSRWGRRSSSRCWSSPSPSCRSSRWWTRRGGSSGRSPISKNLAMAIAALPGHHARPGHAHALRAHRALPVPAAAGSPGSPPRPSSARTTPRSATPSAAFSTGSTSGPAASCCATRGPPSPRASCSSPPPSRSTCKLGSEFMPPLARGPSSTCRRRSSPACRWPRRRRRCRSRTRSS